MSQSVHGAPTVTANIAGTRQQLNLRDYLNKRVAPFLKKALTESLDAEVQYPLQWLGEHLIQQSILYEGNPDTTNIQERFLYKHDIPQPQAPSVVASQTEPTSTDPVQPVSASATPQPPPTAQAEPVVNGTAAEEKQNDDQQRASEVNGSPRPNPEKSEEATAQDVEMGDAV